MLQFVFFDRQAIVVGWSYGENPKTLLNILLILSFCYKHLLKFDFFYKFLMIICVFRI